MKPQYANTAYPDEGVTARQPATTYLCVDSEDRKSFAPGDISNAAIPANARIDTQPITNFTIYNKQSIGDGYIKRVGLTEVNMDWNFPTVQANVNDLFRMWVYNKDISAAPTVVEVFVNEGWYTPTELAAQLTTQIISDISGVSDLSNTNILVSIEPKSLRFQMVDLSANALFQFNNPNDVWEDFDRADLIWRTIGWNNLIQGGVIDPSGVNIQYTQYALVLGSFAPMISTRFVDITSSQLTKKQEMRDGSTQPAEQFNNGLLARIYLTSNIVESRVDVSGIGCNIIGTRPFQMNKVFTIPKYIYWDAREFINSVDIQMRNDRGKVMTDIPGAFDLQGISAAGTAYFLGAGSNTAQLQLTFTLSEN